MSLAYLTTETQGDVAIVTLRAGLFDEMPEMSDGGPRSADVVAELKAANLGSPTGTVLDVQASGNINHRTIALIFALVRHLSSLGTRHAVCGDVEFVNIWKNICGFGSVSTAYADMALALASVRRRSDPCQGE
jgi:hypothetical protein